MALDRQTILSHAFVLLNEAGPENLTLRRLAGRLGVQAPAIYWHFKNKQDLLDEMGTQVMREAAAEATPETYQLDWRSWAMEYGLALRRALLRYREGARMFSGTYLTDDSLYDRLEASLRKLTGAGFSLRDAVQGMGTLYSYTIGYVIEEQAVHPLPGESNPQYDMAARDRRVDPVKRPLAYAAGKEAFTDFDARFRHGLEIIVNGMSALLPDAMRAKQP
jgi:TetR/AcrR family transcriptional regulator, tetracycline repressor protein